ncbi:MAG: four-carbon acid sugar kinase family protein [Actinomycetota bacterium]
MTEAAHPSGDDASIAAADFDDRLPPLPPTDELLVPVEATERRVIAVDDDPTGTQTTAHAALVTAWEPADLDWLLAQPGPIGFVLTNSRARPVDEAVAVTTDVGRGLRAAAERAGLRLDVVSRGDSTLRGHFPEEPAALAAGLGLAYPTLVIMPFFAEGGRATVHGTHYVLTDGRYVPAGATPFARDPSFGYTASHLPAWVEEKSGGDILRDEVTVIDIGIVRRGVDAVAAALRAVSAGSCVVIDAVEAADVEIVGAAFAVLRPEGRAWLFRSAAGLVPALAGLRAAAPVSTAGVPVTRSGGLIVVGSHVPLSTRQLGRLLAADPDLHAVEASVDSLAEASTALDEVARLSATATDAIAAERTVVVHTSRAVRTDLVPDDALARSRAVAEGLCEVVRRISVRPSYVVAKGGITAHTLATAALGARRAHVIGPIAAGVPMWELGADIRHPGLPYVVFPGNVGDDDALALVVGRLEHRRRILIDGALDRREGRP